MVHIRHLIAMGIRKGLMHTKKHMAHYHGLSHVKSHHHKSHHVKHLQLGSGAMHRLSDEEREMEGEGMHRHKHHHRKVKPLHFKF